jgi:hypothetical protein
MEEVVGAIPIRSSIFWSKCQLGAIWCLHAVLAKHSKSFSLIDGISVGGGPNAAQLRAHAKTG